MVFRHQLVHATGEEVCVRSLWLMFVKKHHAHVCYALPAELAWPQHSPSPPESVQSHFPIGSAHADHSLALTSGIMVWKSQPIWSAPEALSQVINVNRCRGCAQSARIGAMDFHVQLMHSAATGEVCPALDE